MRKHSTTLGPLKRRIHFSPMYSDTMPEEGRFQPLFSIYSIWRKQVQMLPERNQANYWNSLTMSILLMAIRMSTLICVRNRALLLSEVCLWSSLGISLPPPFLTAQTQSTDAIPSLSLCLICLFVWPHQTTHAMSLGWKGGRKGRGVFSFSVCTRAWGSYWCAAQSLHRHLKPSQTHLHSTGVNKQWEEGRVKMQREMIWGYKQRHLCKVPGVNWDESRPNDGLCNCHGIKNRLHCILKFHL